MLHISCFCGWLLEDYPKPSWSHKRLPCSKKDKNAFDFEDVSSLSINLLFLSMAIEIHLQRAFPADLSDLAASPGFLSGVRVQS